MCDEGDALGYNMQSKVKLKLAALRRYSCESAENLNEFTRTLGSSDDIMKY